jgi:ubiquitin carboxyl-terminal hydrolase 4/11/15
LLRSYFLSGRYIDEINRDNILGTNGRLVAEFAQLLKTLWTSNNHLHSSALTTSGASSGSNNKNTTVTHYISPSKFKKVVEKCKPIFSGHDQQDAQEFLSEILDSLHEDVNRVVDKPYVAAPEDAIW